MVACRGGSRPCVHPPDAAPGRGPGLQRVALGGVSPDHGPDQCPHGGIRHRRRPAVVDSCYGMDDLCPLRVGVVRRGVRMGRARRRHRGHQLDRHRCADRGCCWGGVDRVILFATMRKSGDYSPDFRRHSDQTRGVRNNAMARLMFRASRFLLMAAPVGILGPRFGGLLFIGIAAFAVISLREEAQQEAKVEARIKQMPEWASARRAQGGPTPLLAAWQKWLLIWGSWGWKSEPLLARSWFSRGRLVPSERSYMLVDDEDRSAPSSRLAVIALLVGLAGLPLAIIAIGWVGGGSLGVQSSSPYHRLYDLSLILLIASYVVL